MATFDYGKSYRTANRLLNKFGGTVFLEEPDTTLHRGYGVFSDLQEKDRSAELTGENAIECWLSAEVADDYVPQLGDYLLAGTDVWMLVQVEPVKPDPIGSTLLYRLVVKL